MKRFFLSIFLIMAFVIYAIYERSLEINANNIASSVPDNSQSINPSQSSQPSNSMGMNSNMNSGMMNNYKNGVYTGAISDAYYGNVQVRATISNGKITKVEFLDYPHDRSTSAAINNQAMPMLQSEAIKAQSANVDIISGATMTSSAFQESLSSALLKAKQ